jgi:serine/threonine protein kinase
MSADSSPPPTPGASDDSTRTIEMINAESGAPIGPYRLIRQLGEGGMGVVYRAQQLQPIRREVALKIIKPGMDSKQVIARFESERQALALMDRSFLDNNHRSTERIASCAVGKITQGALKPFILNALGGFLPGKSPIRRVRILGRDRILKGRITR